MMGKLLIWLLLRITCFRFTQLAKLLGTVVSRLFIILSVSSLTSTPMHSGITAILLPLALRCLRMVKRATSSGRTVKRFSEMSSVFSTFGNVFSAEGNSSSRRSEILSTPVFLAVSKCCFTCLFPMVVVL
uniref:Putative secreted protein n=1 Tax=Anopheles marajoara TaxID=58244 RepID=A0A2M4C749_9DIPT